MTRHGPSRPLSPTTGDLMQEDDAMLRKVQEVMGRTVASDEGDLGTVSDVHIDELLWTLRYLVVETGSWLDRRHVVVSFEDVKQILGDRDVVRVGVTREKLQSSPAVDGRQPVSREAELLLSKYWGWTPHWVDRPLPEHVAQNLPAEATDAGKAHVEESVESVLRSYGEMVGYHVHTADRERGRVADFVCDDHAWVVRYVVVDLRHWFVGKEVLVPRRLFGDVHWASETIDLRVSRRTLEEAPRFEPGQPVGHAYEKRVHAHFGTHLPS